MVSAKEVRRFCKEPLELIENYAEAVKDTTVMWHCHHRNELVDGVRKTKSELIAEGLYWNVQPDALIFLTPAEHIRLHHTGVKRPKLAEIRKGSGNPFYGHVHSAESKAAISEASSRMGQSEYMRELRRKNATGRHIIIGPDGKRHWSPKEE